MELLLLHNRCVACFPLALALAFVLLLVFAFACLIVCLCGREVPLLLLPFPATHQPNLTPPPSQPPKPNRKYSAEIAHNVSVRKRKAIIEKAEQLGVKVTNAAAKLRTEEDA